MNNNNIKAVDILCYDYTDLSLFYHKHDINYPSISLTKLSFLGNQYLNQLNWKWYRHHYLCNILKYVLSFARDSNIKYVVTRKKFYISLNIFQLKQYNT